MSCHLNSKEKKTFFFSCIFPVSDLSYSIIDGNIGNVFNISTYTGEISLINPLDYEEIQEYTLTVSVSDGKSEGKSSNLYVDLSLHLENGHQFLLSFRLIVPPSAYLSNLSVCLSICQSVDPLSVCLSVFISFT